MSRRKGPGYIKVLKQVLLDDRCTALRGKQNFTAIFPDLLSNSKHRAWFCANNRRYCVLR